jgi:hypothetical protein
MNSYEPNEKASGVLPFVSKKLKKNLKNLELGIWNLFLGTSSCLELETWIETV